MHIDDHLLLAPGRAHVLQRVILALAFLLFFLQSALCSSSLGILWPKTAANEELSIVVELASAEHGLSRGNLLWRKDGEEVEVAISRMQELASDIVGFIGPRGSDEARFAARAAVLPVVSPTVTASFLEDDLGLFRRSPLSGAGQEEEAFTAFVTGLGHPSAAVLFQKDSTWASDMALVLITKGVEAGLRVFPCPLKHFRAVNDLAISSLQAHTARICLGSETFCEDLIGFVQDLKIKLNGGGRAMWIVQEAPNVYRSKAWLADVTLFGVMPDVGEPTAAWYRLAGKLGGQVPSWKQAASYDYASVLLQAAAEDQDLCVNKETGYYNSTCVLNNFDRLASNRPDQTFQHQAASFALLMATTDGSKEVGNYNPSADQLELRHELINKLSKPHDIERYLAQRRVSSYNRRASWSPEEHLAGKTFAVGVGMGVFPLSNPRSPTNIICDNSTKRCECGRTSPMIFTSCDAIVQPDNGKNGDPLDWCVIQKFIDNFKCKGSAGSPLFNIEVVELPCDNKDPATCAFYYGTTPPNLVLSSSWSDWVCSYFGRITDPHETAVRKNLETLGLRQPDIAFGKLANTLTIEMDRIECGMQFPKPLMTYGDKIYVAKSNDKSNLEAWSSPFDYDLWFWFLLSLLMAPLILWSVDTNHEEGAEGWVQVVFVTLMSILGTTSFDARRAFGRLLEVSWVLLLFFCTAFYNANLTAKIVKPTTVTLVRGFSDITPEKRLCLAGRYADPKSTLQRRVRRRLKEQSSENIKLKPLLQDLESICRCWCEREHTVDECQECCESTKAQCSKITVKDQQGAFKECNKQEYRIHLIFADPGNSSSAVEVGTVAEKILDINDEDKCQAGLGYDYEITRFFSDNSNLCSDLTVLPDYSWPVSHKSIAFGYHLPKDDVLALSYVVSHLTTDEEAALAYKKWMIKSFNRGPIGGPDENLPLCGSGAACMYTAFAFEVERHTAHSLHDSSCPSVHKIGMMRCEGSACVRVCDVTNIEPLIHQVGTNPNQTRRRTQKPCIG